MKTVLIIDDDTIYRQVMGKVLQANGWRVLEAEEGESGIQMAKAHHPQAVLCDLLMPRCNGFQVCRSLRSDPALRHIKIVVTSGRDFNTDRQAAFAEGADEYLSKPINPDQLLVLLSRIIDGTSVRESDEAPTTHPPPGARAKFWGVRGSI